MTSYGKSKWGSNTDYNSYFSTHFSGDVDIYPEISVDISGNVSKVGTGDLIIRNGNLYMGLSGYINNFPVSSLSTLSSTTPASTLSYLSTLSGLVNSLQLGTTNVGGLNVGGFNMATYETTQGTVAPNYPNYFPIPFPSNYFSYNSGLWSAGTYTITTSSNSTLPAYQAYNVFNSNSTTDLCWVSASGLYTLSGSYKGTTTTSAFNITTSQTSTISGEWIQIQLPYKLVLNLGSLSYYIQPRFVNPAKNAPVSITFLGSANGGSGTPWVILDSRQSISWLGTYDLVNFPYTIATSTAQYQYFRLVISQILGNDTACGLNQWYMLGTPKSVITNTY